MARSLSKIALAGVAGLVVMFTSDDLSFNYGSLVSQAEARVGHPASPGSVAGVARRQNRRGYYGAAAVGAAAGAAAVYGTRCYMTQNGQVCN